jgi:hypothetical protein
MAETVLRFSQPIPDTDRRWYEARVCGGPMSGGSWEGWIEFVPIGGGEPVRSSRETTQPNRVDLEYWATGLTAIYLEGALDRALQPLAINPTSPPPPPIFDGPAPHVVHRASEEPVESVLDPFSVYEKGEAVLRQQLAALSAWHIVNILVAYDLAQEDAAMLNRLPASTLIELVIAGVQREGSRVAGGKRGGVARHEDRPAARGSHGATRR